MMDPVRPVRQKQLHPVVEMERLSLMLMVYPEAQRVSAVSRRAHPQAEAVSVQQVLQEHLLESGAVVSLVRPQVAQQRLLAGVVFEMKEQRE